MNSIISLKATKLMALATILTSCISLASCKDDNDHDGDKPTVTAVEVASDEDNALRYPVKVTTSEDCFVSITYWPTDQPDKKRTTDVKATSSSQADIQINFVKANTDYTFSVNVGGKPAEGEYQFKTSTLPSGVPVYTVETDNGGAPTDGYILQWAATNPGFVTFCDMDGNVVWYEKFDQAIRMAYYDTTHRKLGVLTGFRDGVNSKNFQRLCDKIIVLDLEGNREVQWIASDDNVPYPHHDIKFTPEGDLIMVCNTIKNFDLSAYDLGDDTEVWGDGFTIITTEGEVKRRWNNFDELTPFNSDDIILEGGATKDFLHANSVNWDSDGNYYMTMNRRSELWKIDNATGKVIYRVGPKGNVQLPAEGFASGLHAAEPLAPDMVLCFDNGEDRGYSRAIIYKIDPTAMKAEVVSVVNIPSEYSSLDRSNVQLICDGEMLMFCSTLGRCNIFTDLEGNILKVMKRVAISYRSYYYDNI